MSNLVIAGSLAGVWRGGSLPDHLADLSRRTALSPRLASSTPWTCERQNSREGSHDIPVVYRMMLASLSIDVKRRRMAVRITANGSGWTFRKSSDGRSADCPTCLLTRRADTPSTCTPAIAEQVTDRSSHVRPWRRPRDRPLAEPAPPSGEPSRPVEQPPDQNVATRSPIEL